MLRSHIHGSPRRFYYGLNLTDDPGNASFRSPIRMHYTRMIKYYLFIAADVSASLFVQYLRRCNIRFMFTLNQHNGHLSPK